MKQWNISKEQTAELAHKYSGSGLQSIETGCDHPRRILKLVPGGMLSLSLDLKELGCPHDQVVDVASMILNEAIQIRHLSDFPARGSA